jgi:putative membrane protein
MIEKKFTLRHWLGFLLIFIEIAIASIHPLEVESYLLHQVGTVLMLILLVISFKKIGLDFLSFSFYLGFLFIHILAAHYLYSYVPYNDWIKAIFHFDLDHFLDGSATCMIVWYILAMAFCSIHFFIVVFKFGFQQPNPVPYFCSSYNLSWRPVWPMNS